MFSSQGCVSFVVTEKNTDSSESEWMPEEWTTIDDDEKQVPDPEYTIESKFRDGSERVRNSDGEYQSLSQAIMKRYDYLNNVSAKEVAREFDVSEQTAQEHLARLRKVHGPD